MARASRCCLPLAVLLVLLAGLASTARGLESGAAAPTTATGDLPPIRLLRVEVSPQTRRELFGLQA